MRRYLLLLSLLLLLSGCMSKTQEGSWVCVHMYTTVDGEPTRTESSLAYDDAGRLIARHDVRMTDIGWEDTQKRWEYDDTGRLLRQGFSYGKQNWNWVDYHYESDASAAQPDPFRTDVYRRLSPEGLVLEERFVSEQITWRTEFRYDSLGNPIRRLHYTGDSRIPDEIEETAYDEAGRKIEHMTRSVDPETESGPVRLWEQWEYDSDGNLTDYVNYYVAWLQLPSDVFLYDEAGIRQSIPKLENTPVDFSRHITRAYDQDGNCTLEDTRFENARKTLRTERLLNPSGSCLEERIWRCSYDGTESLLSEVLFRYDPENRLIEAKTFYDGELFLTRQWEYDRAGNVLTTRFLRQEHVQELLYEYQFLPGVTAESVPLPGEEVFPR